MEKDFELETLKIQILNFENILNDLKKNIKKEEKLEQAKILYEFLNEYYQKNTQKNALNKNSYKKRSILQSINSLTMTYKKKYIQKNAQLQNNETNDFNEDQINIQECEFENQFELIKSNSTEDLDRILSDASNLKEMSQEIGVLINKNSENLDLIELEQNNLKINNEDTLINLKNAHKNTVDTGKNVFVAGVTGVTSFFGIKIAAVSAYVAKKVADFSTSNLHKKT